MATRGWRSVAGLVGAALVVTLIPTAAVASPAVDPAGVPPVDGTGAPRSDSLPNPIAEAQAALRSEAVAKLVTGEASLESINGERVIVLPGEDGPPPAADEPGPAPAWPPASRQTPSRAGTRAAADEAGRRSPGEFPSRGRYDRYVSYPVERVESIFTILADFGDETDPTTGGTPGPLHNSIPKPDRNWNRDATDDNSTYWVADFNREHYLDLMFGQGESFKDFYLKQSNGRFLATGDVSTWVTVPSNEARYGSNELNPEEGYWPLVRDTATAWCTDQKAQGRSTADIAAYLAQFDQYDRYDYDLDGVFNEPDGYIDHFQAIHAGVGEEAGGGAQGADAIWSHRWYAYLDGIGITGPEGNQAGGTPICDTGVWIGDYTTEPENGGLGVFTHEFGHDLGLQDYYDTAGGDNSTAFWTLMSAGSWLNRGGDSLGTTPGYMGPHEKLLLGWLDYEVASSSGRYTLGLADLDGVDTPQALAVPLAPKTVVTSYNTPYSGEWEWWGGAGDNLDTTLTRTVDLTSQSSASLSAYAWYNIESGYDALFVQASADGGPWTSLIPTGASSPFLDGVNEEWTPYTWDLSPFAGQQVQLRFRYATDGGVHFAGAFLDDIVVAGASTTVFSDDVESGENGWVADGFTRMSGTLSTLAEHYYLIENRQFNGYDSTLQTGPYNFGWANTRPGWVERFSYTPGVLVWYVDTAYDDNNTSVHPGGGFALPVDARPAPIVFPDGAVLSNRRGAFDATFGINGPKRVVFHHNGIAQDVKRSTAIRTFDDSDPDRYWSADNPQGSVKVAGSGTRVDIVRSFKRDTLVELNITVPSS